jgi:hypothetical protein
VRMARLGWRVGLGAWCTLALASGLLLCASDAAAELVGQLTWRSPVRIDSPSTALPGLGGLRAVSCPSVSLCVAVDASGDVVTSTDPAGGAGAWRVAHVDRNTQWCGNHSAPCQVPFDGISCASASLCVAWDCHEGGPPLVTRSVVFTNRAPRRPHSHVARWIRSKSKEARRLPALR